MRGQRGRRHRQGRGGEGTEDTRAVAEYLSSEGALDVFAVRISVGPAQVKVAAVLGAS
jgi:hypothetical protein